MYNTVDQVVRAALASKGYSTLHKYVLYLHFALEGMYKLKRDGGFNSFKTEKLKVNSRKAVSWPSDMLWYTQIGIPIGGRILNFIPDKSISLNQEDHPPGSGNQNQALGFPLMAMPYDDTYSFLSYTNIYYSSGGLPRNSSIGHFVSKNFRVNEDAREFQLDSSLSCRHVYLQYVTNVTKPNSETIVSHHAAPALQEFIHYREARFKFGAAAAETKESLRDYLDELDESIASQSDLTAAGIQDAISQAMGWSIDQ